MKRAISLSLWIVFTVVLSGVVVASDEGTRHITGDNVDVYFMNDKLFGHVKKHPLWAIYNCGTDIKGEIDVNGTYHEFQMVYHRTGNRKITGNFGSHFIAMGDIRRIESGFVYQVFVKEKEYFFTIKYEEFEHEHLINSIIEGKIGDGKAIKLTVDGRLCPFATTGVILIAVGSLVVS
jgi:hypothetical protein